MTTHAGSPALLFPHSGPALFAAPLAFWLIDTMGPRRVLTLGDGCEALHLALCEAVEAEALNTVCFHLGAGASSVFRAQRARHDGVRSRMIPATDGAMRAGSAQDEPEARYDLIFRRDAAAPSAETLAEWRGRLTEAGCLIVQFEGVWAGQATAHWSVGDQTVVLIMGEETPPASRAVSQAAALIAALAEDAPGDPAQHQTLAGRLAARVARTALAAKHRAEAEAATEIRALRETHRKDLLIMARNLSEMAERHAAQRTEIQKQTAEIAHLRAQLATGTGNAGSEPSGPQSEKPWRVASPLRKLTGKR